MFLAGVVCGAPIVCLIGASYITELTGGGQLVRACVAAALLLTVVGLAAAGLRASAAAQLVLVGMLIIVVVVASAGSANSARVDNWTPFAPHGWQSIGTAAATLMFSFVGWEAVAPLTTRFANPRRQLPRVVAIALAVTSALYLGVAVATISVLGPRAVTDVPLADLLSHAIGSAGQEVAAVAAVVLTLGATNAYINGAAAMAGQLASAAPGARVSRPLFRLLAAITAAGLLLMTLYGLGIASAAALVAVPTALFLGVYLGSMLSAARVLRGRVRLAAWPAALAVIVVLGFCGWALIVPAIVATAVSVRPLAHSRRRARSLLVEGPRLPLRRARCELGPPERGQQVRCGGTVAFDPQSAGLQHVHQPAVAEDDAAQDRGVGRDDSVRRLDGAGGHSDYPGRGRDDEALVADVKLNHAGRGVGGRRRIGGPHRNEKGPQAQLRVRDRGGLATPAGHRKEHVLQPIAPRG
jgi:amino acid efflux transporter